MIKFCQFVEYARIVIFCEINIFPTHINNNIREESEMRETEINFYYCNMNIL